MASDSAIWDGDDINLGTARKLYRRDIGGKHGLLGIVGDIGAAGSFVQWWCDGGAGLRPLMKGEDFGFQALSAVMVGYDDYHVTFHDPGISNLIVAPFYAIGSGAQVALGAMAHGASALEAAEIAVSLCGGCRAPMNLERLI